MSHFEYNGHSETIRLQPENLLVIRKRHGCKFGAWICDPDKKVPIDVAVMVFTLLHTSHDFSYGGCEPLVNELNSLMDFDFPAIEEDHFS